MDVAEPMIDARDQRIRDPVHGLITFRGKNELDKLAWSLLDTPEFQRLRRIKQLGPADFVFPGATHSRFAHCVGVFHTARGLVDIIKREVPKEYDEKRAEVAILAALLHDLGHGPLSHAFEDVQSKRGARKKHEAWSAEIIRNPEGEIFPLLEARRPSLAKEVADLIGSETPRDIYHAVVSSSFDADRLDYLRRDRMMTGTQAGAIDFDWLMEHVRVRSISIDAPDEERGEGFRPTEVATFCLDAKALPAAEQFLLARYTLHEQVYFHKVKRCAERMFAELLNRLAAHASSENCLELTGLPPDHALSRFFRSNALADYLVLDDTILFGALEPMTSAADTSLAEIAKRIRSRELYKTLDTATIGADSRLRAKWAKRIDLEFKKGIADGVVWKDAGAKLAIYTEVGGDEELTHKKLHVLDGDEPVEISERSELVKALLPSKAFVRYYFAADSARNQAKLLKEGL